MASVESLAAAVKSGTLSAVDVARMEKEGAISKTERRKVSKLLKKQGKVLTPRMQLREETKMKKRLPKLTNEDRRKKYVADVIEQERLASTAARTICLGCRERGHFLKDCTNVAKNVLAVAEVCFNCGSTKHALRACTKPRTGKTLPFAKCFICKQTGHISKECPENANGLYPKGGCCHICFQKTHLVRDCPERTEEDKERHRLEREALKERELGPKVKGLIMDEIADAGGDDVVALEAEAEEYAEEEEDGGKKRKKGASKTGKKKIKL